MDELKSKVYYLIISGQILLVTSEMSGSIQETTKEQDMTIYPELKDKNISEVDFIELEYGTLASTLKNIKSYSVNLSTKTLDCVYLTQEEIDTKASVS